MYFLSNDGLFKNKKCIWSIYYMFLEDSIREFKKKMKIGQFKEVDPEEAKRIEEEKKKKEEQDERLAAEIKVGTRYVYHFRSCLISSHLLKNV